LLSLKTIGMSLILITNEAAPLHRVLGDQKGVD